MTVSGSDDDQVPARIGRYDVLNHAGEGAMADIYRAHDPDIDRYIAIKVLKTDLKLDDEDLQRFVREARAAGALTHPNIVTIFDVGETDGVPYITMELLEGDTLADRIDSGQQFTVREVLEIAIDLAKALDYAHSNNVVHRDIKPSNILFAPSTGRVKVADFGIARLETAEDLNKTMTGVIIGTPRYMSPEQAIGNNTDGRSDLYALGVILYEMLTGARAYSASSTTALLLQITQEEPRPMKDLSPDIPTGLQRVVSKLLSKQPDRRFQTGAEVAEALERELAASIERELDAKRDKFVPLRVKWAAAMGAIVSVVLLVSIWTVVTIQGDAIQTQTLDAGSSLAKFVATEAAIPVLGEDWIRLETFVSDASERDTLDYLIVADHEGVIRASTATAPTLEVLAEAPAVGTTDDVFVTEVTLGDDLEVFNFDAPVLFQQTPIGRVHVGISREGLNNVMSTTVWLMTVLALITITAVVGMLYVFGGLLAGPLRGLRQSMSLFAQGDIDHRTSLQRNDEIGELFTAFNEMADAVQKRVEGGDQREAVLPPLIDTPDSGVDPDATVFIPPSRDD